MGQSKCVPGFGYEPLYIFTSYGSSYEKHPWWGIVVHVVCRRYIVLNEESLEKVENKLEQWREALENKGLSV